jgi:hypothetical protein
VRLPLIHRGPLITRWESEGGRRPHKRARCGGWAVLRTAPVRDRRQAAVQAVPFRLNAVGAGFVPLCVPWKPKLCDPFAGIVVL